VYLEIPRAEGAVAVDPSLAALDARELYKAGERRQGTDEHAFIRVFSECGHATTCTTDRWSRQ
jgi:annexin A7/11